MWMCNCIQQYKKSVCVCIVVSNSIKMYVFVSMCSSIQEYKNLYVAVCMSIKSTNTLGKGMNPIILPPAMGKL